MPEFVRCDRRHHGDAPRRDQVGDGVRAYPCNLTHQAQVDRLPVHMQALALGREQAGILTGLPDGERAVGVDQPDEFTVDLAHQDHADDVHRLGRRHPQPTAELGGDIELLEHRRDLGATAVDDDGVYAGPAQEDDVFGEGLLEVGVDHGVAAVFDQDDPAAELLQPRQRLDQHMGLLVRSELVDELTLRCGHEEYSAFSLT